MDGMPLVLIAVVIAAGIIATITLVLDLVERRNFENALRETRRHETGRPGATPGEYDTVEAETDRAGSVR